MKYKYCPCCQDWKVSRKKNGCGVGFYISWDGGTQPVCIDCRMYMWRSMLCRDWHLR